MEEVFTIKNRIINSFILLAPKKGIYRLSMDDLAAEAGISKRTVYRYFSSKDELIEAAVDKIINEVSSYIINIIKESNTSDEALTKLLNSFLNIASKYINSQLMEDMRTHYPHVWRRIDESRARHAVLIVNSLYKKNEQSDLKIINPLIAAEVVKASIQAVLTPDFILRNNLTSEDTLKQLITIFKTGFLHEK